MNLWQLFQKLRPFVRPYRILVIATLILTLIGSFTAQVNALTLQYAKELHPAWDRLSQGAKKLHQRNIHQVLGRDLENPKPSCFLLACANTDKNGDPLGGTRTAWMLAKKFNVPCFNIRGKSKKQIFEFIKPILEENGLVQK